MTDLIGPLQWGVYKGVINDGQQTFNQDDIIWKKSKGGLDRNVEDNATEKFDYIILKALVDYNAMRTWPISEYTEGGMLDKQSQVVMLNLDYLKSLGWLDNTGNFIFEQNTDRIIHRGVVWKCSGLTLLSQAQDEPLLIQLVLQHEIIASQVGLNAANNNFYQNANGSIYTNSTGNIYINS